MHHLSADAPPLESGVHKELCKKKRTFPRRTLQPPNVSAVDSDDANLREFPLLVKAGGLSDPVQVQFANDVLHPGEIQACAEVEIQGAGRAKSNLHNLSADSIFGQGTQ